MSRKLHLAATDRDTERGLSSTPGPGTPREDVAAPKRVPKTATPENEDVEEIEEDGKKMKGKTGKQRSN